MNSTNRGRLLVDATFSDSILLNEQNQVIKYNSKVCLSSPKNDSIQIERIWDFSSDFSKKIIKEEVERVDGRIKKKTKFGNSYSEEGIQTIRYYNYDEKGQLLRIPSRDNYRDISEFFVYYESGLLKEDFSIQRQELSGKRYQYTFYAKESLKNTKQLKNNE